MKKRILALVLALVMLVCSVPTVFADANQTEEERIMTQCTTIFKKALYASGRSHFRGYCGLQTGMQVWKLGITSLPEIYDGKDYYDAYKKLDYTDKGYKVTCLGANTYTLEESLNSVSQCGTVNVYNIIVGFQRTNTSAGSKYGHAMFVHAILDGYVYFLEDFKTLGAARTPVKCTIEEFSDYYCSWAKFEGIIVLGQNNAEDLCQVEDTDLLVVSKGKTDLLAQPAADAAVQRKVAKAEVLHATAIYENTDGVRYYRVTDGYLPVSACTVQLVGSSVTGQLVLPENVKANKSFTVTGEIYSPNSGLQAACVEVLTLDGEVVASYEIATAGHMKQLSQKLDGLDKGTYRLRLSAEVSNIVGTEVQLQQVVLWEQYLGIGQEVDGGPEVQGPTFTDGWNYIDGVRYFYQNGAPRVGWYCDNGADYYFKEDGSVTVGWAEINGRWRYFSDTGVMRTGWLETNDGTYYMLSNGVAALGEKTIDGVTYTFNEEGILQE